MNYNIPVYVGKMDAFHELFDVEARDVRKSVSIEKLGDICYPRLIRLYDTIIGYVEIEGWYNLAKESEKLTVPWFLSFIRK